MFLNAQKENKKIRFDSYSFRNSVSIQISNNIINLFFHLFSVAQPIYLCPVDLHKLQYLCGFDVIGRYKKVIICSSFFVVVTRIIP